ARGAGRRVLLAVLARRAGRGVLLAGPLGVPVARLLRWVWRVHSCASIRSSSAHRVPTLRFGGGPGPHHTGNEATRSRAPHRSRRLEVISLTLVPRGWRRWVRAP